MNQTNKNEFNSILWKLGQETEDAILPSINSKWEANFKRKQDIFDIIDFHDVDKRIACEVKGRRNKSSAYPSTIITLNKTHEAYRLIDEGWQVYYVFVFTDKTMYCKLTGEENWEVKLTGSFQIEHNLIPISELKEIDE
jgi:hypothetical protein|tara:strand:+ start:711 stop:1127 length:417 start_codon:yes stop_codon:yes gene_type:complete